MALQEAAVVVDMENIANNEAMTEQNHHLQIEKKLNSSQKLRRYDSLEMESRRFTTSHARASKVRSIIFYLLSR